MKIPFAIFLTLFILFSSKQALAFPELVRHGYVNCTACHLSPAGGGLLNPYGRELSKELLSTWARDGEQNFAYGAINPPEKLLLGAYVRALQLYEDSPSATVAKAILMQADVEAAYNAEKWAIDGTVGRRLYYDSSGNEQHSLYSRRHYVLGRVSEKQTLRFGRFQNEYGINDPNHELFVRDSLGFGNDTESYGLEYSYGGENWTFFLTGLLGNFHDKYSTNQEHGASATASYFFLDKDKVGLSYLYGESYQYKRNTFGPWGIISLTDKLYVESETDYQVKISKIAPSTQSGYVTEQKLAYDIRQGITPYGVWEYARLNLDDPKSQKQSFGAGIHLYPRPHIELTAEWQKLKIFSSGDYYADYAWIMANFYL